MPKRIDPSKLYPAGHAGVRARMVPLGSGLRVRVVEAGEASATPVVLLSGWGNSAYLWRKNLPALADAGLHPIAVDLKGQGGSDKPAEAGEYTLDSLSAHVVDVLDALSLERVPLVGLSLGGAIAIRVALRSPERVERLALLGAVGLGEVQLVRLVRLLPELLAPVWSRFARRWTFEVALRLAYGDLGRPTARDVDEYYAYTSDAAFARSLWSLIHRVDWGVLSPAELRRLRMPVLAIFGTRDRIVLPGRVHELMRDVPGARVVLIEGAGHACAEEAPDAVNRALLEFLPR